VKFPALLFLLSALPALAGEWKTSPDARLTESPGVLAISSLGKDPWIATTAIPAGARGPFELRIRLAGNAGGNGAVYFLAEPGQDYSSKRVVSFPFEHDGQARDVKVKLPCPTLLGFRLDPGTLPGEIEITALSLHDAEGREVKRWVGGK
jgi:hypothetical protein